MENYKTAIPFVYQVLIFPVKNKVFNISVHFHSSLMLQEEEGEEHYPAMDKEGADQTDTKKSYSKEEYDEDGLDDLPSSICRRQAAGRSGVPISRKVSQTSVYLQEWDIPYEQLQLGELIGKVKADLYHRIIKSCLKNEKKKHYY